MKKEYLSKAQKAKFHMACESLGWSETERRLWLKKHFYTETCNDLERSEFHTLMAMLCSEGYRDQPTEMLNELENMLIGGIPENKRRLFESMAVNLCKLDRPSWDYSNAIARRRWGKHHVAQCSPKQLYLINGNIMARNQDRELYEKPEPEARQNVIQFPVGAAA